MYNIFSIFIRVKGTPFMRIFINDIPVRIVSLDKPLDQDYYHVDIDAKKDQISPNRLIHHVIIRNASIKELELLLNKLHHFELENLYSLTLTTESLEEIRLFLNQKYKVIEAAGGLVRKKDKTLMIYRLKKWDLPKGKIEKNESKSVGAVREVEEECGVKAKIVAKIGTTRHTYTMKNKNILKKTTWYLMDCIDDSAKMPQTEEFIEDVKWLKPKEVHHALQDSYQSIRHVFKKYYKMMEEGDNILKSNLS